MMMRNRLMVMTATAVIIVVVAILTQFLFLNSLLQMNFGMSFLLIRTGKFTSACIALERLLAGMGP
jgi:low affinity Fe/Cu permease